MILYLRETFYVDVWYARRAVCEMCGMRDVWYVICVVRAIWIYGRSQQITGRYRGDVGESWGEIGDGADRRVFLGLTFDLELIIGLDWVWSCFQLLSAAHPLSMGGFLPRLLVLLDS
jgi:hypothetical protein